MQMKKKRGGFTLVEIMVVVTLIGFLAMLSVPAFKRIKQRAAAAEVTPRLWTARADESERKETSCQQANRVTPKSSRERCSAIRRAREVE
jgi:prepilin-type N-terminal cleavage/methylation domain-containing protein